MDGRLRELVQRLDALGPGPTLVDLAQAMQTTRLTLSDVSAYVQRNPHHYNRALVAYREHYELLVMTWLPDQASVPHDHAGSVCVMQVMQGNAVEGSYQVADDGYVDLEYETTVRCGEITAGQDAGVHTVRNASNDLLVTVHLYAPPLKDFRRFVPRPEPLARSLPARPPGMRTIAIVGGGFSGSATAAQLLHQAHQADTSVRVVLVERRGSIGEGLAYATREASHLLNVPAGRMSAWPDRPDDFVQWAARRYGEVKPTDFLPRQWYGEYVRELVLATAREVSASAELDVQFDEARRVARHPGGGWMVHLARGASVRADTVVLAIGHRAPSDPIGRKWSGPRTRFISDPWRPFAMNVVRPDEAVVILGSGLTAVDAVLSLAQAKRSAPITLVSRNGLLPLAHAAKPVTPADLKALVAELLDGAEELRACTLFRRLRRAVRDVTAAGGDWRSVIDGIRPHTAVLWAALSVAERRRFLARLRPFWEVHRHRMALAVAERFNGLLASGQVRVIAGRVAGAQAEGDEVRLMVVERGNGRFHEMALGWVINCTGPMPSNSAAANPAIGSLLVDRWLQPDALGLGIETTPGGNAIDATGNEVPDLFVVGTLRKPASWESTAVPELREQAAGVAECILAMPSLVGKQAPASMDGRAAAAARVLV